MAKINQSRLDYFTAHALSGLLANTQFTSINGQKYLAMKKLSIEALAVQSALETMDVLERLTDGLAEADIKAANKTLTDISQG